MENKVRAQNFWWQYEPYRCEGKGLKKTIWNLTLPSSVFVLSEHLLQIMQSEGGRVPPFHNLLGPVKLSLQVPPTSQKNEWLTSATHNSPPWPNVSLKSQSLGDLPMVQWLRVHTLNAWVLSGQGTRSPHATTKTWCSQINKNTFLKKSNQKLKKRCLSIKELVKFTGYHRLIHTEIFIYQFY